MITAIWAALASPLGRKIALAVAIAAALGGAAWYVHDRGYQEGKADGAQEVTDQAKATLEAARREDRQQTEQMLKGYADRLEAALARADAAEARARAADQALASLSRARQQAAVTLAQVPDPQLHQTTVAALALRDPRDATSCYTYPEEREIATRVTQYPLCQQQNQQLQAKLDAYDVRLAALEEAGKLQEERYQAEHAYRLRVEGYYAQLWNLTPPHYRAAKCLWLWKCGRRTLPTPSPGNLTPPKP